jgi:hypothetical protein
LAQTILDSIIKAKKPLDDPLRVQIEAELKLLRATKQAGKPQAIRQRDASHKLNVAKNVLTKLDDEETQVAEESRLLIVRSAEIADKKILARAAIAAAQAIFTDVVNEVAFVPAVTTADPAVATTLSSSAALQALPQDLCDSLGITPEQICNFAKAFGMAEQQRLAHCRQQLQQIDADAAAAAAAQHDYAIRQQQQFESARLEQLQLAAAAAGGGTDAELTATTASMAFTAEQHEVISAALRPDASDESRAAAHSAFNRHTPY